MQELTGVGETELAALTSGLKIGPKGRFMKAVKRTAFCNGATVFIIFLVFSAHFEVVTLGESPCVFASLCTTTSVVVIAPLARMKALEAAELGSAVSLS